MAIRRMMAKYVPQSLLDKFTYRHKANIEKPHGELLPNSGPHTLILPVAHYFNQSIPNAMLTSRMGYCNAFERLGIPYLFTPIQDLATIIKDINDPLLFMLGHDFQYINDSLARQISKYPKIVWVNPWFKNSTSFYRGNGLNPDIWEWSREHKNRIVYSEPSFVFSATVPSSMHFFDEWQNHDLDVVSLPLACDTTLYSPNAPHVDEYNNIKYVFVGGYWPSKAIQLDMYLRPLEDDLVVYGYNSWPYSGYRGELARHLEPSLYKQALLSPTINEPSVRLLGGQINERVFKILGSGGVTVVDAVPQYRELFSEDELPIPNDMNDFHQMIKAIESDEKLREKLGHKGFSAINERHTYNHRTAYVLKFLGLDSLISEAKVGQEQGR